MTRRFPAPWTVEQIPGGFKGSTPTVKSDGGLLGVSFFGPERLLHSRFMQGSGGSAQGVPPSAPVADVANLPRHRTLSSRGSASTLFEGV
jgi:hypothetical protein